MSLSELDSKRWVEQSLEPVSAQNAKDAADDIIGRLHLTPADKNRKYQLVTFVNDEDCRFFYPRRALDWQRQVNTYISRGLRLRRIRVQRIAVTPADYLVWRQRLKVGPDTPELRRTFADSFLKFLN
jgi:hypothetical protein